MKIAVVPQYKELLGNEIFRNNGFDLQQVRGVDRAGFSQLKLEIENRGHQIDTIDQVKLDDIDLVLFHDINYQYLYKIATSACDPKVVYMMFEAPSYIPFNSYSSLHMRQNYFDCVLTWNDNLAKKPKFRHYNLPYRNPTNRYEKRSKFKNKKLLVNISSRKFSSHPDELYSARRKLIKFYDRSYPSRFNLYGSGWNQPTEIEQKYHGNFDRDRFECYCGLVDDKISAYHKHRFAVCFENQANISGWITEKIFDCFRAGTVPIYWGASNVSEYIPEEAFIDFREFSSIEELHEYISTMGIRKYERYVNAAQNYLNEYNEFLPRTFGERISNIILDVDKKANQNIDIDEIKASALGEKLNYDPNSVSTLEYLSSIWEITKDQPGYLINNPEIIIKGGIGILPKSEDV